MPRSIPRSTATSGVSPLHQAAWPDMFTNLQTAYSELTRAQFELERRTSQIEEARDLFQLVVESMSEALFLVDRGGRIVRANAAARALLGRDDEELVGQSFAAACGTTAIPATAWEFAERTTAETMRDLDVDVFTQSGRPVPVSASCGLVRDQSGKIIGTLVVARDITERKRAAEALARQAAELARSNAELERFAYVASHDLQEPLRMMASYAQLLAEGYQGKLDADADEFIGFIVDGARRMQALISDLLALSRVDTRAKPFALTNCPALVERVSANLGLAIEEFGAQVVVEPLPTLLADETQLAQVFQNLIGNALKFRADRPVEIRIGAARHSAEWCFFVRDNGIGIDARYAERIFVMFQRLHTREEYPGTGIGLALCKKIVERHGGQIWVESERGRGSTFYFTIPDHEVSQP